MRITPGIFFRNVSMMVGGVALSQFITLATSPVLTRFYSPEDFGALGVYTSLVTMILVVVSLRFEMAIPLPDSEEETVNLLAMSISVVGLTTFILVFVVLTFGSQITHSVQLMGHHTVYLWLLTTSVLGAGVYQCFNYYLTKHKNFAQLSKTRIWQSAAQMTVQLASGLLNWQAGLMLGDAIGRCAGSGTLLQSAQVNWKLVSLSKMKLVARKYRKFPMFVLSAGALNILGLQFPTILMAHYFKIEAVGYYSLSMKVLGLPSALISQALWQVLYPKMAESNDLETRVLIGEISTILWSIAVLVFGFVAVFGPELFKLVFGAKWVIAGYYSRILAPWFLFSFISTPLSGAALAKGKQKQALWITCYETLLRAGAILLGIHMHSVVIALVLFSLSGVLISLIYIVWVFHFVGASIREILARRNWLLWLSVILIVGLVSLERYVSRIDYIVLGFVVFFVNCTVAGAALKKGLTL